MNATTIAALTTQLAAAARYAAESADELAVAVAINPQGPCVQAFHAGMLEDLAAVEALSAQLAAATGTTEGALLELSAAADEAHRAVLA